MTFSFPTQVTAVVVAAFTRPPHNDEKSLNQQQFFIKTFFSFSLQNSCKSRTMKVTTTTTTTDDEFAEKEFIKKLKEQQQQQKDKQPETEQNRKALHKCLLKILNKNYRSLNESPQVVRQHRCDGSCRRTLETNEAS